MDNIDHAARKLQIEANSRQKSCEGTHSTDSEQWTATQYLAYGVGHVLNDMCASTWFSYLLVFLREVVHLSPIDSAIIMFSGQIADGVATPLVGIFSDRSKGLPSLGLGKRKFWVALGALCVLLCFFFVFATCAPRWFYTRPSRLVLLIYYSITASLFNCGWAAVQVSHMAMVPELSNDNNVRCILSSVRYAFTILSNVLVFGVFYLLIHAEHPYNVPNASKFTHSAYVSLCVGGACVLFFLIGTKERTTLDNSGDFSDQNLDDLATERSLTLSSQQNPNVNITRPILALDQLCGEPNTSSRRECTDTGNNRKSTEMGWSDWFYLPMFYKVGLAYMCTRLVVNMTQVYIPLYLIVTLHMGATSIALVPLVVYLSGFIATIAIGPLKQKLGRAGSFNVGSALIVIALTFSYFLEPSSAKWIYLVSVILGIGNSVLMVCSVCLEGDLVGTNVESGAFVYGAMSFTDKVSNGIAILFIQNKREETVFFPSRDADLLRKVFCIIPSLAAIVGAAAVLHIKYSNKSSSGKKQASDQDLDPEEQNLWLQTDESRAYGSL
uniref:GlycosidePentosideHexuronide (GPH):Cation Symporter Family putative n=1 Tax=Albugo laibachii Nc14 TaxID=890382 RepID=F0WTE9_9STRA|nr:GlycosidePentosideHexuronide (GPH):Cation Symporter Family putative [Albugo laibachii Nc14]|eukprot:CCA24639.1 GlycosidePentosideHexuronide (GPH):Cation Symporter Family putative [Albugo laibachii Nc14]